MSAFPVKSEARLGKALVLGSLRLLPIGFQRVSLSVTLCLLSGILALARLQRTLGFKLELRALAALVR